MRRRFPADMWVAVFAICMVMIPPRSTGAGQNLSRGVSDLVFHLTTYDKKSNILHEGQGILVGSHGQAIVSISTLEGAVNAEVRLMDGNIISVRDVQAVDEGAGLAMIRLGAGAPRPLEGYAEDGVPRTGMMIIFSELTMQGKQVCAQGGITTVKIMPDIDDMFYIQTSRPIPQPGAAVFDSEGMLLGIVVMKFGSGRSGILASRKRLTALAGQRGRRTTLEQWSLKRENNWCDMVQAMYMKGQVAMWQGHPEVTVGLLGDHLGSSHYLNSKIAALLGEAYLAMDFLPEAIRAFKVSINLGSPPCRAYQKLAWVYMELGQYDMAEAMCRKAIVMEPDSPSGYTLMAHLRNRLSDFKNGVYEARRALMRDPSLPCAHFERGRGYIGLARYEAAIESLMNATTLDPDYGEAFNQLGYAYLRQGKPLKAIVVLKEAVALEPELGEAWANLGEAYSRAGLPDKALGALSQAVCLDLSRSYPYCRLAREFMKQRRFKEAEDTIRQGLSQVIESQWLIYYLGKVFYQEGRIDLAREQAQRLEKENEELAGQLLRIIDLSPAG